MKRVIYFCFSVFITFALSMACFHSCKDTTPEPTITVDDTPKQAQQCVDELIEYLKPDRYAWSYDLMQGKFDLIVDFVCKIEIYYTLDTKVYYAEYVCYIIDNDVDFEELYYERI